MAPRQNQFSFVEYLCTAQSNLHMFPVKSSRAAHFTVIESPRTLLTLLEKKYPRKEKRARIRAHVR